ncbi:hypothetical protein XBKQ1_840001 [Xenorhabdus bovienii str. kraussei Quebec]|uniref:Uncharacterized protein n=2 Tax=Xenorhabdus bovienii TaxID=40576 RepID=A0A077PQ15_XENBV|nr:hypothetical protein XBKQ1_840001 [Xenorhabdus bovienii str. kraussei Quebec]
MYTKVLNNRDTHVLANHSETVEKNQTITVNENKEETVTLNSTETVKEVRKLITGTVPRFRLPALAIVTLSVTICNGPEIS